MTYCLILVLVLATERLEVNLAADRIHSSHVLPTLLAEFRGARYIEALHVCAGRLLLPAIPTTLPCSRPCQVTQSSFATHSCLPKP